MNINYKAENKENKQLNLEKRNKQNSGIPKPVLYTGLSIAGVAAISIIGKILYDKSKKDEKFKEITGERVVNGIKLSVSDQKWIRKNMFNPNQVYPLCWNNVSLLFLAGPEYRSKKFINSTINSNKIIKIIDYTDKILKNQNLVDCFSGNVEIDKNYRPIPDNEQNLLSQYYHFLFTDVEKKYDKSTLLDLGIVDMYFRFSILGDTFNYIKFVIENSIKDVLSKEKNNDVKKTYSNNGFKVTVDSYNVREKGINGLKSILVDFCKTELYKNKADNFVNFFGSNDINFLQEKGYYPTFVAIGDDRVDYKSTPHWMGAYIIYDKNQNIKYFLWADGCKNGLKVMSKEEALNKLKKYVNIVVKYSSKDIVEEFYTPEFTLATKED
ncbi:MAG: hypothetical protein IJQ10_01555 [Clostridia bacterium]|nr:hypothetical protein [Clostridia bacterium]